jgi:hypothetical protein
MSNFSPSKFLDELYNNYYLKNKDEWTSQYDTHNYVIKNLSFMNNPGNVKKHYELLRYIIYQLCSHKNDNAYLNFLKEMFFTLLEENAISLEHVVSNKENLHSLLSIPELNIIFDHGDGTIRISNTKVQQFVELLEEDKTICDKIKQHIDSKNSIPYSRKMNKTNKAVKIFHPYSKKGGKNKNKKKKTKKSKNKNNKNNKNNKKDRKSKKSKM